MHNEGTWDHDDDSNDQTAEVRVTKTCYDTRPVIDVDNDGTVDPPGTVGTDNTDRPIENFKGSEPKPGTATVQWAAAAPDTPAAGLWVIQEFDKDSNTIFVATMVDADSNAATPDTVLAGSALVLGYDSNDRFNKGGDDGGATTYSGFEKALAKGASLTWNVAGSGSRAVHSFTVTAAPPS